MRRNALFLSTLMKKAFLKKQFLIICGNCILSDTKCTKGLLCFIQRPIAGSLWVWNEVPYLIRHFVILEFSYWLFILPTYWKVVLVYYFGTILKFLTLNTERRLHTRHNLCIFSNVWAFFKHLRKYIWNMW